MTDETRYKVVNSTAVAEQFRRLAEEAKTAGQMRVFLAAARWVMEELARTPLEFGESWTTFPGSKLIFRRAFARPLQVQFAVDEDNHIVYISRFAPTKGKK